MGATYAVKSASETRIVFPVVLATEAQPAEGRVAPEGLVAQPAAAQLALGHAADDDCSSPPSRWTRSAVVQPDDALAVTALRRPSASGSAPVAKPSRAQSLSRGRCRRFALINTDAQSPAAAVELVHAVVPRAMPPILTKSWAQR